MSTHSSLAAELRSSWLKQAQRSPLIFAGLVGALLLMLLAIAVSAVSGDNTVKVTLALMGGTAGFVATVMGACLALVMSDISARRQDSMLGFAAGMMLAASAFSLILPGVEAGRELFGNSMAAAATVVLGLGLGVLLMLGLDHFTPHEHEVSGAHGPKFERISRVWLFVLAITLHNLPEGMAIGVGFAAGDMSVGLPLATAIAIQDIPEGLAVALALRTTGLSMGKAVLVAAASGLMEPLGALLGITMSSAFAVAYPVSMGLAAGAMIFVVSHEVIPETHRNGHQTPATIGLMIGFAAMMFLDTALG
ncbi:MAG: ZIP family metal transporter [Pseudomonas sp.]